MKKNYQLPAMQVLRLRHTNVVTTSSQASAPSATRSGYGTASEEDGTIAEW